jgi:hypothetical protein
MLLFLAYNLRKKLHKPSYLYAFSFKFRLFGSYKKLFRSLKSSSSAIDSISSSHSRTNRNRCSSESPSSPSYSNTTRYYSGSLSRTISPISSAFRISLSSIFCEGVRRGHSSSTTEDHCSCSSSTKTRQRKS